MNARDTNRVMCPQATEFIDLMREEFGEVTVVYVCENDFVIGAVPWWRKLDAALRNDD